VGNSTSISTAAPAPTINIGRHHSTHPASARTKLFNIAQFQRFGISAFAPRSPAFQRFSKHFKGNKFIAKKPVDSLAQLSYCHMTVKTGYVVAGQF
jgi:hypothetical protein